MSSYAELLRALVDAVRRGRRVAFCTVVGSHGSTPQAAGASLILNEDMSTQGTLGGGCVEAEVRKRAFELLQQGKSELLTFTLNHDYGWDDGLICGGTMKIAVATIDSPDATAVFAKAAADLDAGFDIRLPLHVTNQAGSIEEYRLFIEAPAKLIIAGAGHVGAELARLAVKLDFQVWVFDDRGDMMGPERLPAPIQPVVGDSGGRLREFAIDGNTYVVIVTRGHSNDEKALHAVIQSPARYVGMIGSRRKVKLIFDDLAALGVDRGLLTRVHAPIGLPIGAVTVPEIAVSILAQMIEVRRAEKPAHVEGPFEISAALARA
ncbi:MAG TPA: XdhC family protein [Phycisphaerae bacterium]|nr:XdhC family protein [Phycisphaerae bacterium]